MRACALPAQARRGFQFDSRWQVRGTWPPCFLPPVCRPCLTPRTRVRPKTLHRPPAAVAAGEPRAAELRRRLRQIIAKDTLSLCTLSGALLSALFDMPEPRGVVSESASFPWWAFALWPSCANVRFCNDTPSARFAGFERCEKVLRKVLEWRRDCAMAASRHLLRFASLLQRGPRERQIMLTDLRHLILKVTGLRRGHQTADHLNRRGSYRRRR
jgi:hypothetical protein